MPSRDPLVELSQRFTAAIRAAFPEAPDADPLIAPCKNPEHGDFQSNAAMGLAKRLGQKPRDAALALVAKVDAGDLIEPLTAASIAGPGFINIRLRPQALASMLAALDSPSLGIEPAQPPRTIVVDLMGVNLAKQMHVGHLRSPIIGDAIARTLERLGHTVVRQNHVGDWGLNIAMVTGRLMREIAQGRTRLETLSLDELDRAYVAAQAECQRDLAGLEAVRRFGLGPKAEAELGEQVAGATEAFTLARQTLINLQKKEPATYAVWQRIYQVTMQTCVDVCKTLAVNVTDEHTAGESTYADELAPMVQDVLDRGIAVHDQGAVIIRVDEPPAGADGQPLWKPIKEPCIIRKTDGGFLYATTDVCAIRRRVQKLGGARLIYVIDARQNLHLRQVFAASIRAGYSIRKDTGTPAHMEHAAFGAVLGEDGRPFKTRSGDTVRLADLLSETFGRAEQALKAAATQRGETLEDAEASEIARAVGIAALKYGDLSTDRTKDYLFSFDRMLAFEGNTGPYLLYAYVRTRSILRKAAERGMGEAWKTAPFSATDPAEKQLALALLRYPGAVAGVAEALEPHRLCQYLYDLAGAFSVFFDRCPVLAAEPGARDSRLRACALTARVLADGLGVLGIPTIERM